jgi:hypothetical protein
MTLSQVVGQYMEVMNKLEALVEDIMRVSPQRMGDVGKSETATGAQTSIARSTNVTRPWFYFHDLVKEEVLTELLELAKIAYIDGGELEYITDEFEVATLQIDGDKLNASDMGVFVTNSYEDRAKKEQMEALLSSAVQQGKASLLDVANVLDSNSMSYIKTTLAKGEQKAEEAANAQNETNQKIASEQLAKDKEKEQVDRVHEKDLAQMEIDKDIAIARMEFVTNNTEANDPASGDGLLVEAGKQSIEMEKLDFEREKEENRKIEKQKELALKEKEINIKKKQDATKSKSSGNKA